MKVKCRDGTKNTFLERDDCGFYYCYYKTYQYFYRMQRLVCLFDEQEENY